MSEFNIEVEREDDGRWIGEVTELPGAVARTKALAFRVLADRLEDGEDIPEIRGVFAVTE